MKTRKQMRAKRKLASRTQVAGTAKRPRLAVYRSNTKLYAQLVNDETQTTLFAASVEGKNSNAAVALGKKIAEEANAKGITSVVFDRGGFRYHGVVKIVADTVREGGLKF